MLLRAVAAAAIAIIGAATTACSNPLGTHYEYEEDAFVSVDGRVSVTINASLASLVALRGLTIDLAPAAPIDRDTIRRLFEAAQCRVTYVSRLWERHDRRYVQIQVSADHIRDLPACTPLAWSSYSLVPDEAEGLRYRQIVGPPRPADPGAIDVIKWTGDELVAFRLHMPSRIRFHNVKRLDGENGSVERGNILTWEQRLADRRAAVPVDMHVEMDAVSILNTTLWLFGGAFAAAIALMAGAIWLTIRRGRKSGWPSVPKS